MAKSKKTPPSLSAPKLGKDEWAGAHDILLQHKDAYEEGRLAGYEYNTYAAPLLELYESSNRSAGLLEKIQHLNKINLLNPPQK